MKNSYFILTTFLLFLFIPKMVLAEYNSSCIFTPNIQLVNISLDMVGTGEYFPDLVETTDAYYSVRVTTVGNWSQYQYVIHHMTFVQCDDEQRQLGTGFKTNTYKLSNGTVMTDFIDEGRFYVTEGKKHCDTILTKIYATNTTWEEKSGCERGINNGITNCLCFVNGLSGKSDSLTKEVLTKEQFYSKKANEIAKTQSERDIWNVIIGAIIAGVFTILAVVITFSLDSRRYKKEKKLKALEQMNEDMTSSFFKINEAGNIQPKTLEEYRSKVEIPKDKFENILNVNSIWFDKNLSDAIEKVRLSFRQVSRAIWMNLPKKELPKGFSIDSYPRNYKIIDWSEFNSSFNNAQRLLKKRLE